MTRSRLSRRAFVKALAAGTAAAGLAPLVRPIEAAAPKSGDAVRESAGSISTRPLGRTGHAVRLFSLGGQATLEKPGTDEESIAIIERAIDLGVNYLDTARMYGRGLSEGYLGQVMKRRRKEVFLASKTRDRTYDGSMPPFGPLRRRRRSYGLC